MITIKDKQAIQKMRTCGFLLASIMEKVKERIKPGVSTLELNNFIEKEMFAADINPVCKGFEGYQHATCISLNDVVVHGVPSEDIIVQQGDLVKIDVVGEYEGYCVDIARSYIIGNENYRAARIAFAAQKALDKAIEQAYPGKRISDLSASIQKEVEKEGFNVVRAFAGHGIGKAMHEEPEIPNFGIPGKGPILQVGMTLAIEPMITEQGYEVRVMNDGWTAKTCDGGLAGHVEDTVLITENGPEVLTRLSS